MFGSDSLEAGWLDGVVEKGLGEGGVRCAIEGIVALRQEIEPVFLTIIQTIRPLRTLIETPLRHSGFVEHFIVHSRLRGMDGWTDTILRRCEPLHWRSAYTLRLLRVLRIFAKSDSCNR